MHSQPLELHRFFLFLVIRLCLLAFRLLNYLSLQLFSSFLVFNHRQQLFCVLNSFHSTIIIFSIIFRSIDCGSLKQKRKKYFVCFIEIYRPSFCMQHISLLINCVAIRFYAQLCVLSQHQNIELAFCSKRHHFSCGSALLFVFNYFTIICPIIVMLTTILFVSTKEPPNIVIGHWIYKWKNKKIKLKNIS